VYNRFPANPSIPNGAKHAYRDLYKQSCGCIVMSIDGTELTQTNFNPYGTWYAGPNGDQFSPEFLGETNYTQSDMPGLPSSKTAFSGLGAQQFTNDTLGSMPCTMNGANDNPSRWTYSASSCTAFDIWTYNTG
jgi:hypothetical protein